MYIVAGHLTWGSVITVAWGRGGGETEGLQALGFQAPADNPLLLRPPGHSNGERPYPGPRQYVCIVWEPRGVSIWSFLSFSVSQATQKALTIVTKVLTIVTEFLDFME